MPNPLRRDAHLLSFALDHPWAIEPSMLTVIATILARHIAGDDVDAGTLAAALVKRKNLPQPSGGAVAVIPVYGAIAPRLNMLSDFSGGTSFEKLTGQVREAMADPNVKTLVLDIDSPGGSVAGATEFFAELMSARQKKPILAQAQFLMGSAAYWLGAAATRIYAAPSALVGSIGVYTVHDEVSKALEALGITRTYISAGKYKVDGNEVTPLTEDVVARIKATVDASYGRFVGNVAKGRGVPIADVRNGYGEGRVVSADEALSLGMIDGIATLDDTIALALEGDTTSAKAALQEPSTATSARLAMSRQTLEAALLDL